MLLVNESLKVGPIEISREMFADYETCRRSGVTNMFDVKFVVNLTGLSIDQIFVIMANYKKLKTAYPLEFCYQCDRLLDTTDLDSCPDCDIEPEYYVPNEDEMPSNVKGG